VKAFEDSKDLLLIFRLYSDSIVLDGKSPQFKMLSKILSKSVLAKTYSVTPFAAYFPFLQEDSEGSTEISPKTPLSIDNSDLSRILSLMRGLKPTKESKKLDQVILKIAREGLSVPPITEPFKREIECNFNDFKSGLLPSIDDYYFQYCLTSMNRERGQLMALAIASNEQLYDRFDLFVSSILAGVCEDVNFFNDQSTNCFMDSLTHESRDQLFGMCSASFIWLIPAMDSWLQGKIVRKESAGDRNAMVVVSSFMQLILSFMVTPVVKTLRPKQPISSFKSSIIYLPKSQPPAVQNGSQNGKKKETKKEESSSDSSSERSGSSSESSSEESEKDKSSVPKPQTVKEEMEIDSGSDSDNKEEEDGENGDKMEVESALDKYFNVGSSDDDGDYSDKSSSSSEESDFHSFLHDQKIQDDEKEIASQILMEHGPSILETAMRLLPFTANNFGDTMNHLAGFCPSCKTKYGDGHVTPFSPLTLEISFRILFEEMDESKDWKTTIRKKFMLQYMIELTKSIQSSESRDLEMQLVIALENVIKRNGMKLLLGEEKQKNKPVKKDDSSDDSSSDEEKKKNPYNEALMKEISSIIEGLAFVVVNNRLDDLKILNLIYKILKFVLPRVIKKELKIDFKSLHEAIITNESFNSALLIDQTDSDQKGSHVTQDRHKLELKFHVVSLLHVCYVATNGWSSKEDLFPILLTAYNASLCSTDRVLLKIFYYYEQHNIGAGQYGYIWGPLRLQENLQGNIQTLIQYGEKIVDMSQKNEKIEDDNKLSAQTMLFDIGLIDKGIIKESINHFPMTRPIYESAQNLLDFEWENYVESSQWYDPSFLLPFFDHVMNNFEMNVQQFVTMGGVSFAIAGFASEHLEVRMFAYQIVSKCFEILKKVEFKEKRQLLWLLELLRNSVTQEFQRLTTPVALFVSKSLFIQLKPEHHMFMTLNNFILSKPTLDLTDIPMFYNYFDSATETFRKQRSWILHILLFGLQTKEDVKLFRRRHVFELLLSFFDSSNADTFIRKLIMMILIKACSSQGSQLPLIQAGILSWLSLLCTNPKTPRTFIYQAVSLLQKLFKHFMGKKVPYLMEEFCLVNLSIWRSIPRLEKVYSDLEHLYLPLLQISVDLLAYSRLKNMEGIHYYIQPNELLPVIERIEFHCANKEVVKPTKSFDDPLGLPPSLIDHNTLAYKVKSSLLEFSVRNPFPTSLSDEAFMKILEWTAYTLRQCVMYSESQVRKIPEISSKYQYEASYPIVGQLFLESLKMYLNVLYQNPKLRDQLLERKSFVMSLVFFYPFTAYMQISDLNLQYLNAVLLTLFIRTVRVPSLLKKYCSKKVRPEVAFIARHNLPSFLSFFPHPKTLVENSEAPIPVEDSEWAQRLVACLLNDAFCGLQPLRFVSTIITTSSESESLGDFAQKELMIMKSFEPFGLDKISEQKVEGYVAMQHNVRDDNLIQVPTRPMGG